ncbi:MAG TPA: MarR family transcriptional regulator [Firmicutes bacterium]|nr:MarR family transcriptional regulator [Bacillota bacterium]
MKQPITDTLAAFNQLYKEMDEIYHLYAKKYGISDATLWLMYSLCENDTAFTQRELCSAWHYPRQTINSALKGLEKQELIVLEPVPGNQKNKRIVLTEKGKNFVEQVIDPLILAEQRAFQELKEKEKDALLSLTQKYVNLLQVKVNSK